MNSRFGSPSRARRAARAFGSARVRPLLALALAQAVLFGSAPQGGPAVVSAQSVAETSAAKKGPRWIADETGGVFIIQQGEQGSLCRVAPPEEARRIRTTRGGQELRQINHLDDNFSALAAGDAAAVGSLTIILRATPQLDANPTAKNAFIAAAAKWEALIKDPITIIIDVDYGTTAFGEPFPSTNTLGITMTQGLYYPDDYMDVRQQLINSAETPGETAIYSALPTGSIPTDLGNTTTVVMQSPTMRALGFLGQDARNDTNSDIGDPPSIAFNSGFSGGTTAGFDFNPADGINGGRIDFDAVAVHEIGHALGFDSNVGLREVAPTAPLNVALWDLYRFRPGTGSNNFTNSNRILTTGGTQVYFDGGPELGLSTGNPAGDNGDGNQASHWKDDSQSGFFVGIMDPNIPPNRREEMTANDIRAIDFLGYRLGAAQAVPANDNFSGAQVISGATGQVTGTNTGASKEGGEPSHEPGGNPGGRSVWFRWTAPGTGTATFDTLGSSFDTLLAAYTGTAVNALSKLASNDDISPPGAPPPRTIQSRIQFPVQAGVTYSIAVDGFNGIPGNIVLNWTAPAATPTPTPTPVPTPTPGGPNTVQFSTATHAVSETATSINVAVTRTGVVAGASSVVYSTANGTASDRSDYMAATGTLNFAPGEESKTIQLFVVNDRYLEPSEGFTVTLSGPIGSTLGAQTTTSVNIASEDTADGQSPVSWDANFNTEFFVRQHYLDFFNREADAAGLAFWSNQIDSCGANVSCLNARRVNVSAAFFLSEEFQQTGYLVYLAYQSAFVTGERLPFRAFLADTHRIGRGVVIGQPGAAAVLEANKVAFFDEFVARQDFTNAFPASMSRADFVNTLANNAGASISQTERNALIASALSRAQILRAIVEDSDFRALHQNRAFVLTQYFGYLRRAPNESPNTDFAGFNFWLQKLNDFGGNFVSAQMVEAFLTSGEYIDRFGQ